MPNYSVVLAMPASADHAKRVMVSLAAGTPDPLVVQRTPAGTVHATYVIAATSAFGAVGHVLRELRPLVFELSAEDVAYVYANGVVGLFNVDEDPRIGPTAPDAARRRTAVVDGPSTDESVGPVSNPDLVGIDTVADGGATVVEGDAPGGPTATEATEPQGDAVEDWQGEIAKTFEELNEELKGDG